MSDYLPKDVLLEILSKLPLKPLIQFTTVCKTWYSIITNPNFISFHHNILNNKPNRRPLLFIRHYNMFDKVERYALHFDDEEEGVVESESDGDSFDEYLDLKCPETTRNEFLRIVGCCKGVVCLSDDYDKYTDTVVLWNPIIRRHLNLPRPNLRYNGRGSCIYGFGFDVVKCDYKVVRVVYNSTATEDYKLQFPPTVEFLDKLRAVKFLVPPGVEVYSLSSGVWRSVSGVCPSYILHQNHSVSTYLNGGIHWIASNSSDDDNVDSSNDDSSSSSSSTSSGNSKDGSFIVAFDVGTENFSEISLPESVSERNVMKLDVMVTGTSLALIEYEKFWQSDYCWVWVMKEYGEVKSWSRLHNIDLRGGFRNIVGFRSHGELLISARMVGMVSYNPKKRNISYLGIHGTNRSFHGEPFFESLALVGKEDRFVQQADSTNSTTDVVQEVGSVLDNGDDGTEEHK